MTGRPPSVREWRTKLAGVTYSNADGTSRQAIIARHCRAGMPAWLIHEPGNAHDTNAHGVWIECTQWLVLKRRVQIGYLSVHAAHDVASKKRTGHTFSAEIDAVTGGIDGQSLGVNLLLREVAPRPR